MASPGLKTGLGRGGVVSEETSKDGKELLENVSARVRVLKSPLRGSMVMEGGGCQTYGVVRYTYTCVALCSPRGGRLRTNASSDARAMK